MNEKSIVFKISEDDAYELLLYADEIVNLNNEVRSFLDGVFSGNRNLTAKSYAKKIDLMSYKLDTIKFFVKRYLAWPDVEVVNEATDNLIEFAED